MHITVIESSFNPKNPKSAVPEGQTFEQTRDAYETAHQIVDRLDGIFDFMKAADDGDLDSNKTADVVELSQAHDVAGESWNGSLRLNSNPGILSGQVGEDQVSLNLQDHMTTYEVISPKKVYMVEREAGSDSLTLVEM